MQKKILLFSYNPVPTPEFKTVEGSALRFWRMALALQESGFKDLTIAVWEKSPIKVKESNGINITNFSADPTKLKKLIAGFDTVIFTCAMGDLSKTIFDAVPAGTRIIIDAYSPVYVELLTKSLDKKDDNEWLSNYMFFADAFNYCLVRADHILIGNDNQRHFYRGVLAGIGALPEHEDDRFIVLPAFVERTDRIHQKRLEDNEKINVLWFGGVYPWFDIKDLIRAFNEEDIKRRAQLTIVGGSNPFYPADNMRFNGKYIQAKKMAAQYGLTDTTVFFEDWVEYAERIEVFNKADIAISINSNSIENDYSFRLRVADLVGNGVPVITNAGDPLGELLVQNHVAFRLDTTDFKCLSQSLNGILVNRQAIKVAKKKLISSELYDGLHIYQHAIKLAEAIALKGVPGAARRHNSPYQEALYEAEKVVVVSELTNLDINVIRSVPTKNLLKVTLLRLRKTAEARLKQTIAARK